MSKFGSGEIVLVNTHQGKQLAKVHHVYEMMNSKGVLNAYAVSLEFDWDSPLPKLAVVAFPLVEKAYECESIYG